MVVIFTLLRDVGVAARHWRGVIKDVELRNSQGGRTAGKNGLILLTKNLNDTGENQMSWGELTRSK